MTEKITSADVYENVRGTLRDKEPFDRTDVEIVLERAHHATNNIMPSAKSFLDWARREGLVETVSRGHYRWAVVTEQEAAEVGRQIAAEAEQVLVSDTDPEHPMIPEPVEVETCQHHADDLEDTSGIEDARVFILNSETRIPRKKKKQIKKWVRENMGIEKVQLIRDVDQAWKLANR